MSTTLKYRLLFAGLLGVVGLVIGWLLDNGGSTPLHNVSLSVAKAWILMNAIPFILAYMASGNPHTFSATVLYLGFLLQWFLVGLVLSFLIVKGS
jgi:hypothetical protein